MMLRFASALMTLLIAFAGVALAQGRPKPLDLNAKALKAEPAKPLPKTMPMPRPRPGSADDDGADDDADEEDEAEGSAVPMSAVPLPTPSPLRTIASAPPVPAQVAVAVPQPAGPGAAGAALLPRVVRDAEEERLRVASLPPAGGKDWPRFLPHTPGSEVIGTGLNAVTSDPGVPLHCLPDVVRAALADVARRFGPVIVRSTLRERARSRRRSFHLTCQAADIRVQQGAAVLGYLRSRPELGGVKRYPNGLIHLDDGPKRSW